MFTTLLIFIVIVLAIPLIGLAIGFVLCIPYFIIGSIISLVEFLSDEIYIIKETIEEKRGRKISIDPVLLWKIIAGCAGVALVAVLISSRVKINRMKHNTIAVVDSTVVIMDSTRMVVDSTATGKKTRKKSKKRRLFGKSDKTEEEHGISTKRISDPIIVSLVENMTYVEGGTFSMGAPENQTGPVNNDEFPQHEVTLKSFYISKYPITQQEFENIMGYNPSLNKRSPHNPVENVSWEECKSFVDKLSMKSQRPFRLVTETEWEYAARGGKFSKGYTYSGGNDINEVAWTSTNSGNLTHPVGSKKPNELGVYDMSGNVWEWCTDWYEGYHIGPMEDPFGAPYGTHKVARGGSYINYPSCGRVTCRLALEPGKKAANVGLRVAITDR